MVYQTFGCDHPRRSPSFQELFKIQLYPRTIWQVSKHNLVRVHLRHVGAASEIFRECFLDCTGTFYTVRSHLMQSYAPQDLA
jgi:hypothetical protein